jgi:hypothetical protein
MEKTNSVGLVHPAWLITTWESREINGLTADWAGCGLKLRRFKCQARDGYGKANSGIERCGRKANTRQKEYRLTWTRCMLSLQTLNEDSGD